jgi:hypothetical protein
MKLLITLLLVGSFAALSQKKECNCRKYQTGEFYIPPDDQFDETDTVFISRTKTMQTERVGKNYTKDLQVIWISPCKYVLRPTTILSTRKYHPRDVIAKIIETTDEYYVVKAWAPKKKKLTMKLYVVK